MECLAVSEILLDTYTYRKTKIYLYFIQMTAIAIYVRSDLSIKIKTIFST